MENRIDILNELRELSPLIAGMVKTNVFTIPEGYFDALSSTVLSAIREEDSSMIDTIASPASFKVPEGYFETLSDNILARIKMQEESSAKEIRALSPMLYSIQNENVYAVPRGYFENLAEQIMDQVKPQPAKLVPMRRRVSGIMKYAVAAVFTGLMALAVFKYTDSPNTVDPVVKEGIQIANENKFDEELAKLSDADIIQFLENNGTDADAALVANSIDENELPSPEDYLLDDKTLDNYLNNINISDLEN